MEQEHDSDDLDTILAQYASGDCVPNIRKALQQVGLPLDAREIKELIACYPRMGPGPFRGFGSTLKDHQEVASTLHAIHMMLRVHHDEPWGEYEIGGEG